MKKKLIVWTVLCLQVFLIICFWLMQADSKYTIAASLGYRQGATNGTEDIVKSINIDINYMPISTSSNQLKPLSVDFIRSGNEDKLKNEKMFAVTAPLQCRQCINVNNFTNDFYELTYMRTRLKKGKSCFYEGTANLQPNNDMNNIQACICRPQWHGSDCSQPEVVWRTLMGTKRTFNWLIPKSSILPHRLTLLVEGNFFNKDLLELQLRSLSDVVDDIIILVRRMDVKPNELKALERKLIQIYGEKVSNSGNYMIIHCTNSNTKRFQWQINMVSIYGNCTTLRAQEKYRQQCPFKHIATDLFLYVQEFDLLSPQALKFFKYYSGADMPIIRFRLKYNVYGFYWQHPDRTRLSGLLSSFAQLHHPLYGKGDPQRLIHLTQFPSKSNDTWISTIIGDLNHFGGWYCLYCQHPSEIISHLHAQSSFDSMLLSEKEIVPMNIKLPNNTRNKNIDVAYVEKIIANGIYLNDGHTQLMKLRYHLENNFAPKYAEQYTWKFSNILMNAYETFDDGSYEEIY